ncbi:MAG: bifunctional UDP-3-O-[3-hydroxymyristoyl] N-acetylglucosamine deacetylase/3-hydroxyacyl-ACP dehydratase [Candidatus Krumholzibacteriia bacterium]
MTRRQATIGRACSVEGIGLHTGTRTRMTFKPAPEGTGIVFRRVDRDPPVDIPARIEFAPAQTEVPRNTTLERDGVQIHTVEHVLAAVSGLGIDNLIIEIDASEPGEPVDGSCMPLVESLREARLVRQAAPRQTFELTAVPYDGFRVSFTIVYDNPVIGTQHASFDVDPETFAQEIAPARTFALLNDVRDLKERGWIRGGTLDNAVVVDGDHIVNDVPLRFRDEFVRHKILDLIGDLTLLGLPIRGHIIAVRSGHQSNAEFVRRLRQSSNSDERHAADRKLVFDIQDILEIMPHRYPILLVDRILELEDRKRVVGIKNVTFNEPFFQGHFPGHPVMPAVLIIEAMAQCGGVLLLNTVDDPKRYLVYFTGIDNARFRRPVRPGDQLRFELKLLRFGRSLCKMEGKTYVDGDLVAEAVLLSSIVER